MRDHLHRLSILALPLSLIFSMAIIVSDVSTAQGPSCLGVNRCETWVSNGGTTQCAALYCSQSRGSASCNLQNCARIRSSCGSGSHYEQSMTCQTGQLGGPDKLLVRRNRPIRPCFHWRTRSMRCGPESDTDAYTDTVHETTRRCLFAF